MASRKLERGDVVVLKCGGPAMVVASLEHASGLTGCITVNWFMAGGQLASAQLAEAVLELVSDTQSRLIQPGATPPGVAQALRAR